MQPRTLLSTLGFALLGVSAMGCAARGGATVATGVSADASYNAGTVYTDTSDSDEVVATSGAEVIIEEPAPQRVVFREPPPLVVVEPDVYVVQDSSYAIYFVDGYYWHVGSGGGWYRTSRWDEPWAHVDLHVVPPRISHRDHHAYVHFHASASAKIFHQPRTRGSNDRALRVADPRAIARARADRERNGRVEQRIDMRNATPAAGPKPERRRVEPEPRRSAPKVDPDIERRRIEPSRRVEPDRVKPMPRPVAEPPKPRPELDRHKPLPQPEQARPDDKRKVKKKLDDKRKPKAPGRDRDHDRR